jgi:hypothetical protein
MWRKILEPAITLSLFAFVMWQTYRYSPVLGHCLAVASLVIFGLIFWSDSRRKKRLLDSEHYLAGLHCPNCDTVFGSAIAHDAMHPPPPTMRFSELTFTDDFGMSWVECNACQKRFIYHRMAACLQWKDEGGEIVQLHPHRAEADG